MAHTFGLKELTNGLRIAELHKDNKQYEEGLRNLASHVAKYICSQRGITLEELHKEITQENNRIVSNLIK